MLSLRVLLLLACTSVLLLAQGNVVISQIYGGGGNTNATLRQDYVELYNRSASAVTMSNWSLQYAASTGVNMGGASNLIVALNGTIQPGAYFLVRLAAGAGGTQDTPAPEATGTIGASSTGGRFALVRNTTALNANCPTATNVTALSIEDYVGWGTTASCFEGSGRAPATENTTAVCRAGNGATDTNNNNTDFATCTPNPRNASFGQVLSITNSSPLPNAIAGAPYSVTFAASGGTGPYTFSIDSGSPPSGLTLSGAVLSGTAQAATLQPASFTIRATDAASNTTTKTFQLSVVAPSCTVTHTISQIQGSGTVTSLAANSLVTTSGIVTARKSNGFFVQSATADNDPATSEGLFVFTGNPVPAAATVGNSICVTGPIIEFPTANPAGLTLTEMTTPNSVTLLGANQPLPPPVTLSTADLTPSGSLLQLERYENMRVQISSLTVTSPTDGFKTESSATSTSDGRFFGVFSGYSRPFREPGIPVTDEVPSPAPCCVPRFDNNPELIRVDSDAQPGAAAINVTTGALVNNLIGVLDYTDRIYTLLPDPSSNASVSGNTSAAAIPQPNGSDFTVASYNLERFYDTVNDPGSDVVLTAAGFERRLSKLTLQVRDILRYPDILALIEAENLAVLQQIAQRLNDTAPAGQQPNYTAFLVPGNDGLNINVGFLVKTPRVTVLEVQQFGKETTYTYVDGNGATQTDILNDRPPLLLRAVVNAIPVTVIVNHLRSLIGVEENSANGNRIRLKRRAQAEFLATLIQSRQAANPAENIISVGDYNAFEVNDGLVDVMGIIKGVPAPPSETVLPGVDLVNPDLTNLIEMLPQSQRYTYTFDGNAQVLDHILVNSALLPRVSRFTVAHTNADFPEVYRSDSTRPERLSDHDAPVVYISAPNLQNLAGRATAAISGLSFSPITRLYSGTVTVSNTGSQTITGTIYAGFADLPAGVSLANAVPGPAGSIPLAAGPVTSLAPGQSVTIPVRFRNPANVRITPTTITYAGTL